MRYACRTAVTAFALLLSPVANAALPAPEQIDALVRPYVEAGRFHAITIGLIDEHGQRTHAYGTLRGTADSPPVDADTLFEIGSLSKVFTGLLLAEMAGRGEAALDDPVQKHLPEGVTLKRAADAEREMTLTDLSTHHSGLPRLPGNFLPHNWNDPYADYSAERMFEFISVYTPRHAPGKHFQYSNLAVGLLGELLARRAEMQYETLLASRITGPLGMSGTVVKLDSAGRGRLAQGHDSDGWPAPPWEMTAVISAGGIRSSANDMLRFMRAELWPDKIAADAPKLAAAIRLSQLPRVSLSPNSEIALGWFVNTHPEKKVRSLVHAGQTGGYTAFMHITPEMGDGVVILTSDSVTETTALGVLIVRLMRGEDVKPPVVAERSPLRHLMAAAKRFNFALMNAANRFDPQPTEGR